MEVNETKLWLDILDSIKVNVSSGVFSTWFSQTHLTKLTKNNDRYMAEVGCNSAFVKSTIEERYYGLVQNQLENSLNTACDLVFSVKEKPQLSESINTSEVSPLFAETAIPTEETQNLIIKANIRPSFTFENFAVSPSNQMAWAAAEAVSKDLGYAYNPLFIWGGVGIGKTHLMSAVGHLAIRKDPQINVLFSTGEQFTNDIVEGIRNKSTVQVRNKYRKLKLLLIDDIQFIAGKDTVQEEFFHTFNTLVASGSQIILTSDRPPSEISKLEERLRSRFEAGLIVDIAAPDFELRCAITQIKAKERGFEIPMNIIQVIAGNITTPRQIEGFLVRLASQLLVSKSEITEDFVQSLLSKKEEENGKVIKTDPLKVISAVTKYYSIGKRALLGDSRSRPIARPRQILMYLLRIDLKLPLDEVGRLIGGRDHTTIMHGVDKITHLASTDVQIREDIKGIKNLL